MFGVSALFGCYLSDAALFWDVRSALKAQRALILATGTTLIPS
jgi:hypothetical protein